MLSPLALVLVIKCPSNLIHRNLYIKGILFIFQLEGCIDIAKKHSLPGQTKVQELQLVHVIPQTALDHFT